MVHFIGSQDSTHDGVSVKTSSMLRATKDRHDFLRVEGEPEDKLGTFEYRDCGIDQKQIGPAVYEPVSSWSNEVAQTQEMESLVPQHMTANTPVR